MVAVMQQDLSHLTPEQRKWRLAGRAASAAMRAIGLPFREDLMAAAKADFLATGVELTPESARAIAGALK